VSKNRSAFRSWFTVDQTVQVAISGDSRTQVPARLIALCSSAVRLEFARPLAEGTEVIIVWNLVSLEGVVVECRPARERYQAKIYLNHVDFGTPRMREHWIDLMEEEPAIA
jgi:hypothetical protein